MPFQSYIGCLAELTDLRGFQFDSIRFDGRLKNNTSISLDSLRYFYAQCAFKGRIHIDIENVMLFKNIWHDLAERQQNFLDTDVGLELKLNGFSDARFDPSNSVLCVFFYDLVVQGNIEFTLVGWVYFSISFYYRSSGMLFSDDREVQNCILWSWFLY